MVAKQKVEETKKPNRTPVFLGVSVEDDGNYTRNFNQLIKNGFEQAGEPNQLIEDFKQILRTGKQLSQWKLPNTHHVTTLFIGGNK